MRVKIVSGIIQEEYYDPQIGEHSEIDRSSKIQQAINNAFREIYPCEPISIKTNTYTINRHNNGGNDTIGYTCSIFYVDEN